MNIKDVRKAFKKFKRLTLTQLVQVTGEREEELTFILQEWESRRKVVQVEDDESPCGGCSISTNTCSSVPDKRPVYFQWVA